MFYYFLVELLTQYDTAKFHGHWPSNREVTLGVGGGSCPPALPDSEKPGLFRVKQFGYCSSISFTFHNLKGKSSENTT